VAFGRAVAVCAVFLVYSVTWAFTWDESYHVLAAQLMDAGRRPTSISVSRRRL